MALKPHAAASRHRPSTGRSGTDASSVTPLWPGKAPTKKGCTISALLTESGLIHEEEVVWLENTERLDYVRQKLHKTRRRGRKPPYSRDERMIGYALLNSKASPDPDSSPYRRRVFFLLPHDRDSRPEGCHHEGAPGGAVDPRTIAPRQPGAKTSRSQTGAVGPAPAAL